MSNPRIKPVGKNGGLLKYVAVLLGSAVLVWPSLVPRSSATPVKSSAPCLRASFTTTLIPETQPLDQEMFGTYFLSDQGFTSKLIVHNQRIDVSVTVTPVLLVGRGREIPLNPITVVANRSVTIDLNRALDARGEKNVKSGGLVLRYAFAETGPIDATVTINHSRHKLSLMSPVMGRAEFMGNVQEGVFWLPDRQTDAFVAMQNTSFEPRHVTPTLFAGGREVTLDRITLGPRETSFLNLNPAFDRNGLRRDNGAKGALRLVNDGKPGDVMAEGALVHNAKGFSKRISFMDTSLHFYDMTLRANFLFLGAPPPELGFPSEVTFRAVCAMHNTSDVAIQIHPVVKYLDGGTVRRARLQDIALESRQVITLDLFEAQRSGAIPTDFKTGTLELACDGPAGSLIAELTNLDAGGGYVLGSSFSGHPSRGVGGTFWRIDGDWQSIITLTNAAPTEDDVSIALFYEGGSYEMSPIKVGGGAIATVNLKELQSKGISGVNGSVLPTSATSGSFCVKGSHELHSAISMERLIFNGQTSECIVLDGTCDHYVTSIAADAPPPTPSDGDLGTTDSTIPASLTTMARWNDGSFSDMTYDATYSSDNTSFVQVTGPSAAVFLNGSTLNASATIKAELTGYGCGRGSFTTVASFIGISIKKSGYVVVGYQNGRCLLQSTCTGTCTISAWSCECPPSRCPLGDKFQCFDLVINGKCYAWHVICTDLIFGEPDCN